MLSTLHRTAKSVIIFDHLWRLHDIVCCVQIRVGEHLRQLLSASGNVRWTLYLLICQVRIIIQWRHLCCESIYWPTKLVKGLIITVLATTLSPVAMTVVALESSNCTLVFVIVMHRSAVNACQARLAIAEVPDIVELFYW